MKQLLVILFLSLWVCTFSSAQLSFARVDTVQVIDDSLPLKNAWAGGFNEPMFCEIDLDRDGKMDLVAFDIGGPPGNYRLMPFLNRGTPGNINYVYAPEYISLFPHLNDWLVTYDYNYDGRMDLFTVPDSCGSCIEVYRNDTNSTGGLKFTRVTKSILYNTGSQYFNIPANSVSVPVMMDVDGDGDMDIVGWPVGVTNYLVYYNNVTKEHGLSQDSLAFESVSGSCWGHFDLSFGKDSANLGVACRVMDPPPSSAWDAGAARLDDTQSCICLYDQDGNITKDAIIGGYADNNMVYIHNGGTVGSANMDREDYSWPVYDVQVNLASFPCSYNIDVDNDGKKDMIISPHSVNDFRGILFYKNTDVLLDTPIFRRQPGVFLQDEMIDVGSGAVPRLFDYNADGLPDLLIGDQSYHDVTDTDKKGITLYKNIGTPTQPKFQLITRDYAGINANPDLSGNNAVGGISPTFGDLNGDGVPDMIVGLGSGPTSLVGDGQLLYFQNMAVVDSPANFVLMSLFYDSIDVGGNAVPQLYDLDHDGLLDLIIGNGFGFIKYYRNLGTATNPVFDRHVVKDTLGGIIARYPDTYSGVASPFFYNDNGVDKLIVGTEYGTVYIYDNIKNNIYGSYHLVDSIINGEEGQRLMPYIGDINNDGHPDMLIGNYSGGVSLYMNTFPNGVVQVPKAVLPSFNAYPNPVTDELHFNFYHIEGMTAQLEIVNCMGQEVYNSMISGPAMTVSLKNLSNGIYLARFVTQYNAQSLKIAVRH